MGMNVGGGGRGGRGQNAVSDINITPLVDVMLVLLIIFMVTAPQIHHGTDVPTPDTKEDNVKTPPKEEEKATLNVDLSGMIQLRNQKIPLDKLEETLKQDKELQKASELFIKAHPDLYYGKIMTIIGTARRSGIKKVGLVVVPEYVALPAQPKQ